MSHRKRILLGAGLLVLLGLLAYRAVATGGGQTTEVRAEVVGTRDLVARVTATGHIEPKRSVDISADVSGRIVELPVEEGENVAEGDLLLVIDSTQFEAAVRQAEAQAAEARAREAQTRADYEQARRDAERLATLQERTPDLVTVQEVEQARTAAEVNRALWEAARYAVERAEAAIVEARDRLEKTIIRAPMAGRITRLNVERGETAVVGTMNNPGSLLLTVADLSVMEAVVEVDETDIPRISLGDSAAVEIDAFPDTVFHGRVTKIGNSSMQPRDAATSSQDQAVDFEVRITLSDPPEGIRPDLSATADIVTERRENVLAIPIIALTLGRAAEEPDAERGRRAGEGSTAAPAGEEEEAEGVFLVRGDRAEFRPVRVGIAGDRYFEVLEGLSPGDTVVSGSYQAIRGLVDGNRLALARVDPAPTDRTVTVASDGEQLGTGGGDQGEAEAAGSPPPPDGTTGAAERDEGGG